MGFSTRARNWTPEEDAVCRELWAKGTLARHIGDKLNRTACAVRCRVSTLNIIKRQRANAYSRRHAHLQGEEWSAEWYASQQKAFANAMIDAGYEMCSGTARINSSGSTR
jgi:hypothetical protein